MALISLAAGAAVLTRVRHRVEDSRAVEALAAPRFTLAPVSILGAIKVSLLVIVLGVAAYWLVRWDAGRDRDAWWRGEIAKKSSAVRGVLKNTDPEISRTDDDVLAAIGVTDLQLEDAERRARQPKSLPPLSECPLVKPKCLGIGDGQRQ